MRATVLLTILFPLLVCGSRDVNAQMTGRWFESPLDSSRRLEPIEVSSCSRSHYVVSARLPESNAHEIYATTNAGLTWTRILVDSVTADRITGLAYPAPGLILVVGDSGYYGGALGPRSFILRSEDGGRTWARHRWTIGQVFPSIAMTDSLHGALLINTPDSLYVTDNAGMSWRTCWIPDREANLYHLARLGTEGIVVASTDNNRTVVKLHRSTDGGSTWVTAPFLAEVDAIAFADSLFGYAYSWHQTDHISYFSTIRRTTDGGFSWTTVLDSAFARGGAASSIDCFDGNHAIAVGDAALIIRTTDGGSTWSHERPPSREVPDGFRDIILGDSNEAIAVSYSTVFAFRGKRTLAAPSIVNPQHGAEEIRLTQNISWTAINGADEYDLQIGDTTYSQILYRDRIFDDLYYSCNAVKETFVPVALDARQRYWFRVRARNAGDTSDWSVPVTASTMNAGLTVQAPTILTPEENETAVSIPVRISWTSVPATNTYDVVVGTSPEFGRDIVAMRTSVPSTSVAIPRLLPATRYYTWVRGANADQEGYWSSSVHGPRAFTTVGNSGVEAARIEESIQVSPNPATGGSVRLALHEHRTGILSIRIVDALGRITTLVAETASEGEWSRELDLSAFTGGVYLLVIDQGNRLDTRKLTIAR